MLVLNIDVCDFVVWTPNVTIVTTVIRDTAFGNKIVQDCSKFFGQCVLPELVTRRYENRTLAPLPASPSQPSSSHDKLYCYCQQLATDDGRVMVGCDNENCQYEWFHLECLKRKTVPKGDWYCKDCKKLMASSQTEAPKPCKQNVTTRPNLRKKRKL